MSPVRPAQQPLHAVRGYLTSMLGQRPPVLPLQPRNKTRDVFPYPSPRFRTKEPSTDPLMQEIQLGSNHIDDHID
jgi:hypothetical protein